MYPKVLIVVNHYLPAFRSGGPVRSVAELVASAHHRIDFSIVTLNHDSDLQPFSGIAPDTWTQRSDCRVYYARHLNLATLRSVVKDFRPDALYLNSLFAPITRQILFAMRLGGFPDIPVVLAPRGELAAPALAIKAKRKSAFLSLASVVNLFRGVQWHATAPHEVEDVRKFDKHAHIALIPDTAAVSVDLTSIPAAPLKQPGAAKFLFLSRIARMKNLPFLLDLLTEVHGQVELNIHGPLADASLWAECQVKIAGLPPNCHVRYLGEVPHPDVFRVLRGHHFFVLPTLGENFGYAIVESLMSGVPVLISDRTPWRNLATYSAGFDISLHDRPSWINALQRCVDMSAEEYHKLCEGAAAYANVNAGLHADEYEALFMKTMRSGKAANR